MVSSRFGENDGRVSVGAPTTRLPWCPVPEAGESLAGYRLRLAEANGYPSPFWLTSAAGSKQRLGQAIQDVEAISALAGYGVAELAKHFLGKEPIPPRFLNVLHPRICPECLRDRPILRRAWDVALVACCPDHRRLLIDACPGCGGRLSWNRPEVVRCGCGFDFRTADSLKVEHPATALVKVMVAKIEGTGLGPASHASGASLGFDVACLMLPLADLLRLVLFLGAYGVEGFQPRVLKKTALSSVAEAHRVVENAARALQDWPRGFREMLGCLFASGTSAPALGARQAHGQMYHYLYGALKNRQFGFLRDAFESYLRDHWDGLFDGKYRSLSADTRRSGRYVSTTTAAQQLGMSPVRVHRLVRSGAICGKTRVLPSGRTLALVERAALSQHFDYRREHVTAKEARKLLGITKRRFRELVAHGVITTPTRPRIEKSVPWRIPRERIDGLLRAFHRESLPEPGLENRGGVVTLRHVLQGRFSVEGDFPAFIKAVESKAVFARGRDPALAGLGGFLFRSADVDRFLASHRAHPGSEVNLVGAAHYLGVKEQVVYHLVRRGLLKCRDARNGIRRTRLVSWGDLERFRREYVTGAEISHTIGMTPRSVVHRLQRLGVEALVGPCVDGSRQYIFCRQRALGAIEHILNSPRTMAWKPVSGP